MFKRVKEIYAYRTMIYSLVKRDLKGRYKGSFLGFLWTFINPLFQLLIYTFVFSIVMRSNIEDYYMFLFVALIPWIFFSTSLAGGSTCITTQKDMVQKIYFPREVIPISYVTGLFINMLLSFLVVFAVMFVMKYTFNPLALLCLIPVMLTEYILALGFTFILSGVTVFFQDMQFIMGILTMAWQFLSPVMYSAEMVPEELQTLYMLINPMAPIIVSYRDILYYAKVPDFGMLLMSLGTGVVLFLIGWFTFDKMQRHFAEEM
ncbi:MAG: ABC transporter permease [Lachnospiraceae bacterium]|nr:ABC transporter permease [Lachnospiraceae bacterium]